MGLIQALGLVLDEYLFVSIQAGTARFQAMGGLPHSGSWEAATAPDECQC